ncbi:hypothetical protein CQS02_09980 [Elizabethkingia miricola]|nr:hypothetical protein CQS02_09980 [Elizabethkingia miricola]OPC26495.1 hypothetical protein BAY00_17345 [Elizabethkingia bruuniana]
MHFLIKIAQKQKNIGMMQEKIQQLSDTIIINKVITSQIKDFKVKNIYFYDDKNEIYNLKLLVEFIENKYLYFDSASFNITDNTDILNQCSWKKIEVLEENTNIISIKEDELTSYFILFSNNDILYIFQRLISSNKWEQNFEIVKKYLKTIKRLRTT